MSLDSVSVAAGDILAIGLHDCVDVLAGGFKLDDPAAVSERGYGGLQVDRDGRWVRRRIDAGEIRIGEEPSKRGCRLDFEGSRSAAIYEATLAMMRDHGFTFVNGRRAAPEAGFVLDTLVALAGPISLAVMFRPDMPGSSMFTMNFYPNH